MSYHHRISFVILSTSVTVRCARRRSRWNGSLAVLYCSTSTNRLYVRSCFFGYPLGSKVAVRVWHLVYSEHACTVFWILRHVLQAYSLARRPSTQGGVGSHYFRQQECAASPHVITCIIPAFFIICVVRTLTHSSYVRVKQAGDPSYSTVDDLRSYTSIKVR